MRPFVDLIAHGGLHVDRRIDLAFRWRVGFPVGTQRHQLALVLQLVHCLVVLRRAGAVDAAEHPDDAGRRFVFAHARRESAFPAGAGDRISLRIRAGRALAGNLEHICPAIEHRKQGVPALHVGDAQHPGLLADVDERSRIERVGVRRGHIAERRVRILSQLDDVAHRGLRAFRTRHVGDHAPGHFHRHERVAVDIGVGREPEILQAFAEVKFAQLRVSQGRDGISRKQAQHARGRGPSINQHYDPLNIARQCRAISHASCTPRTLLDYGPIDLMHIKYERMPRWPLGITKIRGYGRLHS